MDIEIINSYITARYDRWLDYSKYHCTLAGMPDEATDVLNEVLIMLLEKDADYLNRLYKAKKGRYRELDFFVLQMIKLNITSVTSPYRHKYKSLPVDENVDWHRLEIIDEPESEPDRAAAVLREMKLIRFVFDRLELTDLERRVFAFKFFAGASFADWPGGENEKALYQAYKVVYSAICELLYTLKLTREVVRVKKISQRSSRRIEELCELFRKTRKVTLSGVSLVIIKNKLIDGKEFR